MNSRICRESIALTRARFQFPFSPIRFYRAASVTTVVFVQNRQVHIERDAYRAWNWCIRLELVCRPIVGATVPLKKMERRAVFAARPFLASFHVYAPTCARGNRAAWCNDRRRLYRERPIIHPAIHILYSIIVIQCITYLSSQRISQIQGNRGKKLPRYLRNGVKCLNGDISVDIYSGSNHREQVLKYQR